MPRLARPLLSICLLLAFPALADDPFARGFDSVPLKLTPLANSGLQLEGAELRTKRSWQLYSLLDLNFGVMALKLGDQRLGDLIPFRTDLRIGGSYQVLDRLEVGAEIPAAGRSRLRAAGTQRSRARSASAAGPLPDPPPERDPHRQHRGGARGAPADR
jgi:hypothetical protein